MSIFPDYERMLDFIGILVLSTGTFYLIVNASLAVGMWRNRSGRNPSTPFVSVIVAARNEERMLPQLLDRLAHQTYPSYEVIVVNDRSTDRTASVVENAQQRHPMIRGINSGPNGDAMPAKKNALRTGIASSKGEILCFTDADCEPGERWIESLVAEFDERTGMLAGYSPYREDPKYQAIQVTSFWFRFLCRFVAYEEFRGALWAGGSIGWNRAWLCTGRNLAYRRALYDELGGFERIRMSVSGDDDLFMLLARRNTTWRIKYCYDPTNAVMTDPPSTFQEFVNQRKRHFSAARFFHPAMKLFFASYHGSNLILLVAALCFLTLPGSPSSLLPALGFKLAADTGLVLSGSEALRIRPMGPRFILMEMVYVLYNTLIGPLGLMFSFDWKAGGK